MKPRRVLLSALTLICIALASCSPGHLGGNVIAFIRDGHLWTSDPDGANAFEVVAQGTPVIGYSWSPTHRLLAFRALDPSLAQKPAARNLKSNPLTGTIVDEASTINTIGVDGGSAIPTALSSPDVLYSNAMWNSSGTRLLYRQTGRADLSSPESAIWWVAQNDQPGGIAAKSLPPSYSIPSISSTNQQIVGNSSRGLFTTTLAGTQLRYLTDKPLPGHPFPATLERVLWQPGQQNASLLYALPAPSARAAGDTAPIELQLILRTPDGHATALTRCKCTQFAWSPDGKHILYSTDSTYSIFNLADHTSFTIPDANNSVPYWSPDSQFLLLDGPHTLSLVHIADKQTSLLLTDAPSAPTNAASKAFPAINSLLQPVPNSLWSSDSRHFLFLTHNRLLWQNHGIKAGLYTITINSKGQPLGAPSLVDTGKDTQAGWSYQDPNTSFVY
ncbi:hypothetical protein EPA93_19585 [Ktedonosporobacter rubrisoli]|uniref:Dipeptidylpeptidase IV N-terminal domain-containing protein n=1 Tax=Ktedonosporobacter rubrisoli TaxID=2509675 RepID=A0A4P6JRH6_KTERU|nr:hypothetical protein [Ktedonosporobacter rubrisoli]QBD78077.1 hypothetical protein EPA93_19585 [Ktedonosporobacter rubrisoli]